MKIRIENSLEAISSAVADVDSALKQWKIKDEERIKATLALEDHLVRLSASVPEGDKILLRLNRNYRRTCIHIICKGEQIQVIGSTDADMNMLNNEYGPEAASLVGSMMQRFSSEYISASYAKGINRICITVHRNEKAMIYDTLIALLLGVVTALGARLLLPADVVSFVSEKIYSPLYEVFIRAIMIVVGPMIFFSLAACIANLKDVSSLGRTGVKIMSCYMLTTLCAILMTLGFNAAFTPGAGTTVTLPQTVGVSTEKTADPSILDMLINIVPDNFLGAFVNGDMLQILFLGILVGIACSNESKYSAKLRSGIEVMDHLVQKLIGYCVRIMPVAVFGAVGSMVCTLDVKMFGVVGKWFVATMVLLLAMQLVYMLFIAIFARLNPATFMRKFSDAQVTALSTGSSCATMPVTMRCCQRLGISPRLYNFSIPLGASVNMDGFCIVLSMSGLFLANLCGVELTVDTTTSFIITVLMLSVAAPGVSGGGIAMLLIVLSSLGVPAASVTFVMGLFPFFDILSTITNVTGDVAVSLIVAKSEGLLDKEKYNER